MDADNTPALISQGPFWTRDKENRLIGLYSHFSLLWDCRHPDYYRRDRREHAMRAIAAALDNEFDVLSVKEKIKSLRDYFVKELKKEHAAVLSSLPGRYVSRWEHFNALHFLRRVIYSVPATPHTVNVPQAEVKPEPQNSSLAFADTASPETRDLSSLTNFQPPAIAGQASTLQLLPPRGGTQETRIVANPRLPESPPRAPTLLDDVTATVGSPAKRPRRSCSQEHSSSAEVGQKPEMSTLSARSETLSPAGTSATDSNGVPTGAADARGQNGMDGGRFAENLNQPSRDAHNALFCGQLILELRKMTSVQRDYAKLRFMQILFDVKYKA